jgi:hypothetical protein
MATVYSKANKVAARAAETQRALEKENAGVTRRAEGNLARANTTSRVTETGYFPASIESSERDVDHYTTLVAPNAVALEFGHSPSGVFAGTDTKSPDPTYILTRAAIGGAPS